MIITPDLNVVVVPAEHLVGLDSRQEPGLGKVEGNCGKETTADQLHAADSTLAALFMSHVFPRLKPLWVTYTLWMWWGIVVRKIHGSPPHPQSVGNPEGLQSREDVAHKQCCQQGNPAGLARIDKLLGIDLYTSGFKQSPVVFGAFPEGLQSREDVAHKQCCQGGVGSMERRECTENNRAPADYSMQGNPAGLARIDKLLGIDLYTSGFKQSCQCEQDQLGFLAWNSRLGPSHTDFRTMVASMGKPAE
jgi:hypothetical protein